jgi:hypothetical protein
MSCIMAMQMKSTLVAQFFLPTILFGSDMVDFNGVSLFKVESAPFAFSLLFL